MHQLFPFNVSWLALEELNGICHLFLALSKIAGSAVLSGAIGKCSDVIMKLGEEAAKGQISDIRRKSEKAKKEGAHLHTHLCVRH